MREVEFALDKKKEKFLTITFGGSKQQIKVNLKFIQLNDAKTLKAVVSALSTYRQNIMNKLQVF